jgi:predicted CopG family antitoxin
MKIKKKREYMLRKTVTISEEIYAILEKEKMIDKYASFSEMVSIALQTLIKEQKKEAYRKSMIEASKDEEYLKDIEEIQNDFRYVDSEIIS